METLRETCQEYFMRRLSEGWRCIEYDYPHAVLMSPWGHKRELDLRNDVETLRPNAAGAEESVSDVVGDEVGSHYAAVDEAEADDDTSYVVEKGGAYKRDLYNLPASSGSGTINFIKIYLRCKRGPPEAGYAKPSLKSNTTVTDGTEIVLTTDWAPYSQQWNTNPADSEAWEWADIDALQIGVSLNGVGGWAYCTQVYVEVDYTFTPPTPPTAPEYQRRVIMQKQPDGSYKEVSESYPLEVHDPKALFSMDFWSDPQEEVQLTDTAAPGTDVALPDVTVADLPTGATIVRAIAMFKFRMVENTNAAANKLQGAQHIQVRDDTPGTWRDAISLVADQFGVAATTREGGDVIIGDHDIAVEVDGLDTYNFQWAASLVDQANLQFNDVQVGLRIWYEG